MSIQKIQQETINEMEAKSAANIPDRPYDYGYTSTEVKRAFIDPITDEDGSVVSEINRIVDEVNEALSIVDSSDTLDTTAQTIIGAINELKAKITGSASGYTEITVTGASDIIAALNALQTAVTGLGTSKANASSVYEKSATYSKMEINSALLALEAAVKEYADAGLSGKQSTLTFDDDPTANSDNPVKSGGVKTALDGKADLVDGKVPAAQLPSFVDDVVEYAGAVNFPLTGESGKIYIDTTDGKTYRWSGSDYVEISSSLALGETPSTAYAGNKGKANADAIAALQEIVARKQDALTFDDAPTASSNNPVKSGGIKTALDGKQNALTFDNTPTANSDNAITSGGVKAALDTLNSAIQFKTISAPLSSTLTNDEKAAIVAGAYVAAYDDKLNLVFFPANQVTGSTAVQGWWFGTVIYSHPYAREYVGQYSINTSNVLTIKSAFTITDGTVDIFNGKNVPSYPSSTGTFGFESVNGVLSWVEKPAQSVEDYTVATSSWSALSSASPYTHSTMVTATHTIGNDTVVELINDQAVLFAKHGFAVASVSGQVLTIYSIGVPDASVTLEVEYRG